MNPLDSNLERLVRHAEGQLSETEADQVVASLRHDPESRRFLREMAEQAVMIADLEREAQGRGALLHEHTPAAPTKRGIAGLPIPPRRFTAVLAVAASIAILLSAALLFLKFQHRGELATITALDGAIQWTGDGGQVVRNLQVGTKLQGGIIEGIEPLSWFELQFHDGTTVAITGTNGKTTTSFLLASIAREAGLVPGVVGNVQMELAGQAYGFVHIAMFLCLSVLGNDVGQMCNVRRLRTGHEPLEQHRFNQAPGFKHFDRFLLRRFGHGGASVVRERDDFFIRQPHQNRFDAGA